ncbi:hypothetical protein JTB14_029703 [Gonioctena quinquepunctata]|nr:hypothetical protein JTB14_029703 [Gonioctena quinquepunctata]
MQQIPFWILITPSQTFFTCTQKSSEIVDSIIKPTSLSPNSSQLAIVTATDPTSAHSLMQSESPLNTSTTTSNISNKNVIVQQMPELTIPELRHPFMVHEQMPQLNPPSPVVNQTTQNNQINSDKMPGLLNVYSVSMEKTNPPALQKIGQPALADPSPPKKYKPNLIWNNHKYYTNYQCVETFYTNRDRFYPMSQTPISLDDKDKKVIVELMPVDTSKISLESDNLQNFYDGLENRLGIGNKECNVITDKHNSSSSSSESSSSSDSSCSDCESMYDVQSEPAKMTYSETSSYSSNTDGSEYSSDDNDRGKICYNKNVIVSESKFEQHFQETKNTFTKDTLLDSNANITEEDVKENIKAQMNRQPNGTMYQLPTIKSRNLTKNPSIIKTPPKVYNKVNKNYTRKLVTKQLRAVEPRPYLSEIFLGARKKGRSKKNLQQQISIIKNMLNNIKNSKNCYNHTFSHVSQSTDSDTSLSKYLSYKKAILTPSECCVEMVDVLINFSKDIQEYLKSGLTLFNVNSIPIAQANHLPTSHGRDTHGNKSEWKTDRKAEQEFQLKWIKLYGQDIKMEDIMKQKLRTLKSNRDCVYFSLWTRVFQRI